MMNVHFPIMVRLCLALLLCLQHQASKVGKTVKNAVTVRVGSVLDELLGAVQKTEQPQLVLRHLLGHIHTHEPLVFVPQLPQPQPRNPCSGENLFFFFFSLPFFFFFSSVKVEIEAPSKIAHSRAPHNVALSKIHTTSAIPSVAAHPEHRRRKAKQQKKKKKKMSGSSSSPTVTEQLVSSAVQTFVWEDDVNGQLVKGFLVIHSVANGCSFGTLRVGSHISLDSVKMAASEAALTAGVVSPLTGGAAAGLCLPAATDEEQMLEVVARFVSFHAPLLGNTLTLAGETDALSAALDAGMKASNLTPALGRLFSAATQQADVGPSAGETMQWLASRINFSELALSFGVGQIVKCLEEITPLAAPPRVVVDGFGSLGSSLAFFLENLKLARVVAIRDQEGHISSAGGDESLPVAEILRLRSETIRRRNALGQSMFEAQKTGQNLLCNLDDDSLKRFRGVSNATRSLSVDAEVIVLCRDDFRLSSVDDLALLLSVFGGTGPHFLFFARPLSLEQQQILDSEAATKMLLEHRCALVPHWLCVAGRDQMQKALITIPFDFSSRSRSLAINTVLESISAPITTFVQEAYYTFADKDVLNFFSACEKLARHRAEHPLLFTVVPQEKRKMPVEIFNDAANMQERIAEMLSVFKSLVRALLGDIDALLLAVLEDLVSFFLLPALEFTYCADDNGERLNKRMAVTVLSGLDRFFRACCAAKRELIRDFPDDEAAQDAHFLEYLVKQRDPEALDARQCLETLLRRYPIPFQLDTLTLVIKYVAESNRVFPALDVVLGKAAEAKKKTADEEKEKKPPAEPQVEIRSDSEKHDSEFGTMIGSIMTNLCEFAQLSSVVILALRAVLFVGGSSFIGRTLDEHMEPNIHDDTKLVRNITKVIVGAKKIGPKDEVGTEERVVAKLRELVPSIPFSGDVPKLLGHAFAVILGNPDVLKELIFMYLLAAFIPKEEDKDKKDERFE